MGTVANNESAEPSELLTFLIADVRGYTRFTVEHGDEQAARLADRFAAICEELADEHHGRLIELRGDEALIAFPSARNALRGAVALQEQFRDATLSNPMLPLHVGIGLDSGEALPVRGGYRGGALNLAARLCAIAGPGEILASEGVIHLARRTEGVSFADRGTVTLKGFTSNVRVLQIGSEGELPAFLPPLQTSHAAFLTNLPDSHTRFIGRERELQLVTELLNQPTTRLVTLTGPGGTGKTRLALQVAAALLHHFRSGVFFVSLATLTDASRVPSAIADALGLREEGGKAQLERLIEYLDQKHVLIVLDNFEHLTDAGDVVARMLSACLDLHVLVTSRTPLHLSREHEFAVPPLSIPGSHDHRNLDSLLTYESVALFVERAKATKNTFRLTEENAPAVAEICAKLDGLPLALELAASRVKIFPPEALLQRLKSSLNVLTGGAKDQPSRQQTLRATIDWSYSLLSDQEQLVFARLSVFVGGFTFEAAESVCNIGGDLALLQELASLIDKSLVRQTGEGEPRFSMLETIREYARERLASMQEQAEIYERHATFYLELGRGAAVGLKGKDQLAWLDRLDEERDNFRAVLTRYQENADSVTLLDTAASLHQFWWLNGDITEGRQWLDTALTASPPTPSAVRARALMASGMFATLHNDFDRAAIQLQEALDMGRNLRDAGIQAETLFHLGALAWFQGDLDLAKSTTNEALTVGQEAGDRWLIAHALSNLGLVAILQGDLEVGLTLSERSVKLFRDQGDRQGILNSLDNVGRAALAIGDHSRAAAAWRDGLGLLAPRANNWGTPWYFEGLAACASVTGHIERAAHLYGAEQTLRAVLGVPVPPGEQALHDRYLTHARAMSDTATWSHSWNEGVAMTLEQAIDYALADEA